MDSLLTSRRRAFEILEVALPDDTQSRWCDLGLICLISLNILVIVLASINSLYTQYKGFFYAFEIFSVTIFSLEYIFRLWACTDNPRFTASTPLQSRLRYAITPQAVIDLLAVAPFYIALFMPINLFFMNVFRILRIFKLTRYFAATNIMIDVIKQERQSFGAALFVLTVIMMIASTGIFVFEHEAQPKAFGSIPAAMWWAVATLTTVGYGDVTPVTDGGKIFGASITIVGIGIVALPAGILASAFSDSLRRRQEKLRSVINQAWEDGVVTEDEAKQIRQHQDALLLNDDEATSAYSSASMQFTRDHKKCCPHCGGRQPDD